MDAALRNRFSGGCSPAALVTMVIPTICVAICTRDRSEKLQRALRSIIDQTTKPAEILVVDNAPADNATNTLIREEFPDVRYVLECRPGLDFARNRAIAETSQEIIAFMDDDVVASPGWVEAIRKVFGERGSIAICTGKVEALSLETEGERLFEDNGGFARGNERITLPADRNRRLHGVPAPLIAWTISIGAGCSLAVRRRVILELGGFDEALDLGPALPGGGDHDIIWRSLDAGWEVVYDPSVRAKHEHRKEFEATVEQILGHNRALIALLTKTTVTTRNNSRIVVLVFLLWRLMKPGVRLARRLIGRDPLPVGALLRLWWSCLRGLVAYAAARRLAEQRRTALYGLEAGQL